MEDTKKEINEFDEVKHSKKEANRNPIREVLDGSVLTSKTVVGQLPFILFLALLAFLYIGNRYKAESISIKIMRAEADINDMKAESMSISSELMYLSRQSEVAKMVEKSDVQLREATEPAYQIIVDK